MEESLKNEGNYQPIKNIYAGIIPTFIS